MQITSGDFSAKTNARRLVASMTGRRGLGVLQGFKDRAAALMASYEPVKAQDRMEWYRRCGFKPHGLFLPDDEDARQKLLDARYTIGKIPQIDERIALYLELQEVTAQLELDGMPGAWTGQQALARSQSRFRAAEIGRRWGKSLYAAHEAATMAFYRPGSIIWIGAPDMGDVKRIWDIMKDLLRKWGAEIDVNRDSAQEKLIVLANGSQIEGFSLLAIPAGAALDLVIIDEAASVGSEIWLVEILPPLADKQGRCLLISSPRGENTYFHTLFDMAMNHEDPEWEGFNETSFESNFYQFPEGENSPTILHDRRFLAAADYNEQYLGIAQGVKGRIFPQFRDFVHVRSDIQFDPEWPVHLAIDPSNGANAYAVEAIQDYGAYAHVLWEYYVKGPGGCEPIFHLLDKQSWRSQIVEGVMDSARPDEVMRWVNAGFPIIPVPDKPPIEDRIPLYRRALRDPQLFSPLHAELADIILTEWGQGGFEAYDQLSPRDRVRVEQEIEARLADPNMPTAYLYQLQEASRIFFSPSCPFAIEEHKKYRYAKPRTLGLDMREVPFKADDHCLVAGTMVQTAKGPQAIEAVRAGSLVQTRTGLRRVLRSWQVSSAAEVYRASLSNGASLVGTSEHRVWVQGRGWVQLQYLNESCTLESCSRISATITAPLALLGDGIAGLFRAVGTSTTRISTPQITIPAILNASLEACISAITWSSGSKTLRSEQPFRSMQQLYALSALHGIAQMRDGSGIERTGEKYGERGASPSTPASSAERPTLLSILEKICNSARGLVGLRLGGLVGWTTRIASVLGAEALSVSVDICRRNTALDPAPHVIDVQKLPIRMPVYDLTVEGEPEFYANGVLVHNSLDALGYYYWTYHRFEHQYAEVPAAPRKTLHTYLDDEYLGDQRERLTEKEISELQGPPRRRGFLQSVREYHDVQPMRQRSYLVDNEDADGG